MGFFLLKSIFKLTFKCFIRYHLKKKEKKTAQRDEMDVRVRSCLANTLSCLDVREIQKERREQIKSSCLSFQAI